ncbi:MAG: hypothetical protein IPI59_02055 [Sphingobacteriales bacterium]|jgi:hypothetical protein|nr:hypothetical protein [Sphingobacteriales bacterium]MBK6890600.1 hypothetical protein [Sphingobacteriales bacterium]MBK7526349.1 hypothetical protein [Sphingobacteriales bacterium]MBL0247637.1 hypothetical protein [Sphingobacteriales bacterium]
MKKFLFVLMLGIIGQFVANAHNADLFTIDEQRIEQKMNNLNQVEQMLNANPGMSFDALKAQNAELANSIDAQNSSLNLINGSFGAEPPLGIPSFIWGFCLGIVGVVVVYLLTDEDKSETKKALFGCIASAVIWTVLWFGLWAANPWWYI